MSERVQKKVSLVREIYDTRCLPRAVAEYREALLVSVEREGTNQVVVRFSDPSGGDPIENSVRRFLNRLLDLSVLEAIQASRT
jgi:hypothetical protein